MIRRFLYAGLLLAALGGCKQRGTFSATVTVPTNCTTTATFQVRLMEGQTCDTCDVAKPANCDVDAGTCILGCPPGGCPLSELDEGLQLQPQRPGSYAVVVELYDATKKLASSCYEVQFQADGTLSMPIKVTFPDNSCCTCCRIPG